MDALDEQLTPCSAKYPGGMALSCPAASFCCKHLVTLSSVVAAVRKVYVEVPTVRPKTLNLTIGVSSM